MCPKPGTEPKCCPKMIHLNLENQVQLEKASQLILHSYSSWDQNNEISPVKTTQECRKDPDSQPCLQAVSYKVVATCTKAKRPMTVNSTFFAFPCLQPLQIQAKHQVVGPFFQFQLNCLAVTPKIQPVAKNLQIGSLNGHHPDCKDCKNDGAKPRSGSQESSCQHSERGNRSSKAMETEQSLEPFEWKSSRRCCRGAWPNDDEIRCVHLQSNRIKPFQA